MIVLLTQSSIYSNAGSSKNALSFLKNYSNYFNCIGILICFGPYFKFNKKSKIYLLQLPLFNLFKVERILYNLITFLISFFCKKAVMYGIPFGRYGFLIGRILKKRTILRSTMMNDDDLYSIKVKFPFLFFLLNFFRVNYWAISSSFKNSAKNIYRKNLIHHIPQGVRFSTRFRKINEFQNINKTFLSCGYLIERKGYIESSNYLEKSLLIKNMTICGDRMPGNNIGLKGKDQEMKKIYDYLKTKKNITLKGSVDNLMKKYDSHLFFLHNAKQEGMPNVILEAMSRGCIVFVKYLDGIEDIIKDGQNGYYFNSLFEIDKILAQLFSNPEKMYSISKNATNFIKKNYSIQSTIINVNKIIQ